MFPHPAGDVSYDLMAVLKFDLELSPGQCFYHGAIQLNDLLVCRHKYNEEIVAKISSVCKG